MKDKVLKIIMHDCHWKIVTLHKIWTKTMPNTVPLNFCRA